MIVERERDCKVIWQRGIVQQSGINGDISALFDKAWKSDYVETFC